MTLKHTRSSTSGTYLKTVSALSAAPQDAAYRDPASMVSPSYSPKSVIKGLASQASGSSVPLGHDRARTTRHLKAPRAQHCSVEQRNVHLWALDTARRCITRAHTETSAGYTRYWLGNLRWRDIVHSVPTNKCHGYRSSSLSPRHRATCRIRHRGETVCIRPPPPTRS